MKNYKVQMFREYSDFEASFKEYYEEELQKYDKFCEKRIKNNLQNKRLKLENFQCQ